MTQVFNELIDQIDTRMLVLIAVSMFGMTCLAAYLYVFKAPVSEYREVTALIERSRVDQQRHQRSDVHSILQATRQEVEGLNEKLYGAGEDITTREMIPFIIGRLDRLSEGTDIQLMSVTPGQTGRVLMFDEVSFEVSVSGNYLDLVSWLRVVEEELHPMIVKQFEMTGGQAGEKLLTRLKIVSYRPGAEQS